MQKIEPSCAFAKRFSVKKESCYYDILYPLQMLDYLNPESGEYAEILQYLYTAVSMLNLYDEDGLTAFAIRPLLLSSFQVIMQYTFFRIVLCYLHITAFASSRYCEARETVLKITEELATARGMLST